MYLIKNFKLLITILGIFICSHYSSNAQVEAVKYRMKIYDLPVYNKVTGELISHDKVEKIRKKDPNFILEPIINEYGNVDSYWYDPYRGNNIIKRDPSKRVNPGEKLPPFVMHSAQGNILDSDKLNGDIVLLYFQLSFEEPFFSKQKFEEFNALAGEFNKYSNFKTIVVTESTRQKVNKQVDIRKLNEDIVTDGKNFNIRYLINKFPTAILIDREGKLVHYYEGGGELTELKKDVKTQLLSHPPKTDIGDTVNPNNLSITSAPKKPETPKYFLNSKEFDASKLYINPKSIDSIQVERKTPNGEIHLFANPDKLNFLTLGEILKKHSKINELNNNLLFRINDKYINDIEGILIDDSYFVYVKTMDVSNAQYLSNKYKGLKIVDINLEQEKRLKIRGE